MQASARKSLLSFVERGGGFAGVHAATAACRDWPAYGKLIGAYYAGQIGGKVPIRNERPDHPVNACFGGRDRQFSDEIYVFREPYSRGDLRVLLSLDFAKLKAAGRDPAKRGDNDYAVSWVRRHGKGRVFYCSLGHMPRGYWNPTFLKHILAGIQWALGDLPGPGEPLPKPTTVSPGRKAAMACGLPHPKPRSAPPGRADSSAGEYPRALELCPQQAACDAASAGGQSGAQHGPANPDEQKAAIPVRQDREVVATLVLYGLHTAAGRDRTPTMLHSTAREVEAALAGRAEAEGDLMARGIHP